MLKRDTGRTNKHGTVVQGVPGASAWDQVEQGLFGTGGVAAGSGGGVSRVRLALILGLGACVLSGVVSVDGRVRAASWLLALLLGWLLWRVYQRGRGRSARAQAALQAARGGDLSQLPSSLSTWARGALSEESIGRLLARLGPGYRVEHDLPVRSATGRMQANVDHLVRTPSGALVLIDTKRWAGQVELGPDGRLRSERDRDPEGPRGRALETLQWLCEQLRPRPDLVIIAVHGRGTVARGRISVRPGRGDRRARPVVVVHADRLLGEIMAAGARKKGDFPVG